MNSKQIKKIKNEKRNFKIKLAFLVVFPMFVAGIFYYGIYKVNNFIQQRDLEIYNTGFEIGNLKGLEEGYDNGLDASVKPQNAPVLINSLQADKGAISKNPEVNALLQKYFPGNEKIMHAIAMAESAGKQLNTNKKNKNGSWDCGYFMNNTIHRKAGESKHDFCERNKNLETNFVEASKILKKQGLTAWVVYNNKSYLTFLK